MSVSKCVGMTAYYYLIYFFFLNYFYSSFVCLLYLLISRRTNSLLLQPCFLLRERLLHLKIITVRLFLDTVIPTFYLANCLITALLLLWQVVRLCFILLFPLFCSTATHVHTYIYIYIYKQIGSRGMWLFWYWRHVFFCKTIKRRTLKLFENSQCA